MLLLIPNGYVGAQGGAQTSVCGLVLLFSQKTERSELYAVNFLQVRTLMEANAPVAIKQWSLASVLRSHLLIKHISNKQISSQKQSASVKTCCYQTIINPNSELTLVTV
jgi:hypothetical protein